VAIWKGLSTFLSFASIRIEDAQSKAGNFVFFLLIFLLAFNRTDQQSICSYPIVPNQVREQMYIVVVWITSSETFG